MMTEIFRDFFLGGIIITVTFFLHLGSLRELVVDFLCRS